MSEAGQAWDKGGTNFVPQAGQNSNSLGQLKRLAQQVLNHFVPLSQPYSVGQRDKLPVFGANSGTSLGQERDSELWESMRRLEMSDISIALVITETDAGLAITEQRMVRGEEAKRKAWESGAVVFEPAGMYVYVHLDDAERALFRSLKMVRPSMATSYPREVGEVVREVTWERTGRMNI